MMYPPRPFTDLPDVRIRATRPHCRAKGCKVCTYAASLPLNFTHEREMELWHHIANHLNGRGCPVWCPCEVCRHYEAWVANFVANRQAAKETPAQTAVLGAVAGYRTSPVRIESAPSPPTSKAWWQRLLWWWL